jgi:hypothetical protein
MAYSALPAKVAGDTFDLADYNKIKGNFEAGVPDILTTKGDLAVATGVDAAARLAIGDDDSILVPDSGETTGLAWQIQPACRVYNSGNIDPTTSTWEPLTFDSERFDTDAMHSTSSNTGRITIPTGGDGLYLIGVNATLDLASLGDPRCTPGLRLLLNGATVIAQTRFVTHADIDADLSLSTLYSLSAGDYVVAQIYTDEDVDVVANGNYSPEFWAIWQRRA